MRKKLEELEKTTYIALVSIYFITMLSSEVIHKIMILKCTWSLDLKWMYILERF